MPAIAGVRNTNRRPRPRRAPTSSAATDAFSSAAPSNPPHSAPRRRPTTAPTVNRAVAQSLFGDRHKPVNPKQQIRSIHRLLNQPNAALDTALVARKQTELRILSGQLADRQRRLASDRVDRRYKMVKFVERQKVVRRMRSLHRRLTGLASTERGVGDEERAIRAEMERVQADLDYIDYYPRGTKYVALFASSKAEAEAEGKRGQRGTSEAAAEDEDEDSDSELVVGGKHNKLPDYKPAPASTTPPDTNEHKTNTDHTTTTTTPSHPIPPPATAPVDPNRAAARDAALDAQRAAIREAVRRAKEKAVAGDRAVAVVAAGVDESEAKEKRRREVRDDFFVFEGQEEGGERKEDVRENSEEGGDDAGRKTHSRVGAARLSNRPAVSRTPRSVSTPSHARDEQTSTTHGQRQNGASGRSERRDSGDGADGENRREQRRRERAIQHEARRAQLPDGAEHSVDKPRPAAQRKRQRDEQQHPSSQPAGVGQQRSAYNPNKHVRVSEVKKTARKIAQVDQSDEATERRARQPAEERTGGADVRMAVGDDGDKGKRRRKRGSRKSADRTAEQGEEEGEQRQHKARQQKQHQRKDEAVDTRQPEGAAADGRETAKRRKRNATGKPSNVAEEGDDGRHAEEDERSDTKRQEAEVRIQRRQDVKSLLQLDDNQSDEEQ